MIEVCDLKTMVFIYIFYDQMVKNKTIVYNNNENLYQN